MAYDSDGIDLYEAIRNQTGYRGIKAPSTVNHRYINEDVPMSLVPMASIGRSLGLPNARDGEPSSGWPASSTALITGGAARTVDKLGIGDLSVCELTQFVQQGMLD